MVVSFLHRLRRRVGPHFEIGLYVYLWLNASLLAAIVRRPWLGAVGLVTVAPFVVAYAVRCRREAGPPPAP